ncbi:hypothetical protein CDO73_08360 [Saccharibacillus sp. O23]|uniref:hypothetical protein n=1 Tax=Saccharibacillus sp. O23 TaxID=2009338 RepID=UPI000B4E332E|nr:hypothetical protein [Saccharibacillus sp. O23]OWR31139.1 hypothetical protein CDO73_08360 [Saccharibacillus sp. O23]
MKTAKPKTDKTKTAKVKQAKPVLQTAEFPSKTRIRLKRIWIVGTLALGITLGSGLAGGKVEAEAVYRETPPASIDEIRSGQDTFLHALGTASEQEVYDLMYEGLSLREIASIRGGSERDLLALQVRELEQQLEQRLADGQITREAYIAYKAELPEIVAASLDSRMEAD